MASKPTKSSPRAMPVETIITRFKSAQQRRQLREMDRSMNKITELLKNPVKVKSKNPKAPKKVRNKETKKEKARVCLDTIDVDEEYYPMKLKRQIVLNKVQLKPKHDLKVIAQTNKRKRSVPQKGVTAEDCSPETPSRDSSPSSKRVRQVHDMSMCEMIQLMEDSGSLNDEDLLEILTCPSPVWWEDPPCGYVEDALFTRPRSTAEMYPSVRSQLQDNLERKRSNTPNVLSRREKFSKRDVKEKSVEKDDANRTSVDVGINLNKCDDKFIEKRSKLESVLGNLRSKTLSDVSVNSEFNKVSVIQKLNEVKDGKSLEVAEVEEELIDISHDDALSVLENMDIPTQDTVIDVDKEAPEVIDLNKEVPEVIDLNKVPEVISLNKEAEVIDVVQEASEKKNSADEEGNSATIPIETMEQNIEPISIEDRASDKTTYNPIFEDISDTSNDSTDGYRNPNVYPNSYVTAHSGGYNRPMDLAYGKKSSIIEDYLEMKLVEDEDTILHKKQNEYSKNEFISPILCDPKYDVETDLSRSVIKFRNSDSNSIHIVKVEPRDSIVPRELPPLRNSDRIKNSGCAPENLPPLRRNPGVIITNDSLKNKTIPFDNIDSLNNALHQDNLDSISDTNVCFLNEDDGESEKRDENPSVIKSSNQNVNGKFSNFPNDLGFKNQLNFPVSALNFTQNIDMCKDFDFIQNPDVYGNQYNDLDIQSLTITKLSEPTPKSKDKPRNYTNNFNPKQNNYYKKKYANKTKSNKITVPPKVYQTDINVVQNKTVNSNETPKGITVYKIVPDITIDEVTPKNTSKDNKEFKLPPNPREIAEKTDGNLVLYFKKCKNLYWQKTADKNPLTIDKNGLLNGKKEKIVTNGTNNVQITNSVTINNTNLTKKPTQICQNDKTKTDYNTAKKEKCILVSNSKQIRYCMKCSSIFDTAKCNYCYRKNSTDKSKSATDKSNSTDYILQMEQRFVCDVCRYKALSKESLERHISSCKSKNR